MVIHSIVDFVYFLNGKGYEIAPTQINRFFTLMNDADFTDSEDVINIMRITFCSTKEQREAIADYFKVFFHKELSDGELAELKKELKNASKMAAKIKQNNARKIDKFKEELKTLPDDWYQSIKGKSKLLGIKARKFIEENSDAIEKISNAQIQSFYQNYLKPVYPDDIGSDIEKESNDVKRNIIELAENDLLDKAEKFNFYCRFFDVVCDFEKCLKKAQAKARKTIAEQKEDTEKERLAQLNQEIKDSEIRRDTLQEKLNSIMRQQQTLRTIQQGITDSHREVFIGKNVVQQYEAMPEFMNKDFTSITEKDVSEILYYIKRNIIQFKTRMTKSINTKEKVNIDIKETILNACKTGGLPMNICYEKPKANKTNLVLVLDVSGSCSGASKMMLAFMCLLQSVFPRGCKTFAFVNSLYDISSIMNSNGTPEEINRTIKDVFSHIPTRGVYSNYYAPLNTLWNNYNHDITSDSIVIFIGDARNNKNAKGLDFVKNISRKAKRAYWLNTETKNNWGQGDSVAYDYAQYFKMYEATKPADLIGFMDVI